MSPGCGRGGFHGPKSALVIAPLPEATAGARRGTSLAAEISTAGVPVFGLLRTMQPLWVRGGRQSVTSRSLATPLLDFIMRQEAK